MDQSPVVHVLGAAPPGRAAGGGTAAGLARRSAGWWKSVVFPNRLTRVQIGMVVVTAAAALAFSNFTVKPKTFPHLSDKFTAKMVEKIMELSYYVGLLFLTATTRVGAFRRAVIRRLPMDPMVVLIFDAILDTMFILALLAFLTTIQH